MSKWFDPRVRPVMIHPAPAIVAGQEQVNRMWAAIRGVVSDTTCRVLADRAKLSWKQRIATNLTTLLTQMRLKDVLDVFEDGLADREKQALLELQDPRIPAEARAVAHTLLGIPERSELIQVLKSLLAVYRTRHPKLEYPYGK